MNIDLVLLESGTGRQMMAVGDDGWHSELVPAVGAFAVLSPLILAQYPGMFEDAEDCALTLTIIHFNNLKRQCNAAGQAYPIKVQPC